MNDSATDECGADTLEGGLIAGVDGLAGHVRTGRQAADLVRAAYEAIFAYVLGAARKPWGAVMRNVVADWDDVRRLDQVRVALESLLADVVALGGRLSKSSTGRGLGMAACAITFLALARAAVRRRVAELQAAACQAGAAVGNDTAADNVTVNDNDLAQPGAADGRGAEAVEPGG